MTKQELFEEFQKSVDHAKYLAQKIAPEHFYMAYDRCAKLQKVIFKRACGYCFADDSVPNSVEKFDCKPSQSNLAPISMCYPNFSNLLFYQTPLPLLMSGQNSTSRNSDIFIDKVILLKNFTDTAPTDGDLVELDRDGCVLTNFKLPIVTTAAELSRKLFEQFIDQGDFKYDIYCCIGASRTLIPLKDEALSLLPQILNFESRIYLRPKKFSSDPTKLESSLSPLSFQNSESSVNSGVVNSFIQDSCKNIINDPYSNNEDSQDVLFPETMFISEDVLPPNSMKTDLGKPKPVRKYNWNVVLSKLHEVNPIHLSKEILRSPDICHELHAIPPTSQKLRPTKRCQLCLKGYKRRKESRYFCRACDKGFHIKCFEVYHQQLGCTDFTVKIISGER